MRYISQARQFNQSDIDDMACRAATGLHTLGIEESDAVALLMVNEIEILVCNQALAMLGAYPVPISWHSSVDELAYITSDAQVKAVIAHDVLAVAAAQAIPTHMPLVIVDLPPETAAPMHLDTSPTAPNRTYVAWSDWMDGQEPWKGDTRPPRPAIIYTSGTTGRPKGVVREAHASSEAQQAQARNVAKVWGVSPGMRTLLMAPLYHSAPSAYIRATIGTGGPVGEIHFLPRFDAEEALRIISSAGITHMWMVPTMFVRLLDLPLEVRQRYDVSSVQNIIHSGAPCPVGIKQDMISWFGPVINEFYGSTEVGPVTYASSADYLAKPGTVGRVLDGCRVEIVDADGAVLPRGEVGEIAAANGTYADFTYHNRGSERDELNSKAGVLLTGDIGVLDDDGYLFIKDRKKDMVISGGVNLYPAEVENVLLQIDNVVDGAAFGLPDPVFGERMVAAVSLAAPEEGAEGRIIDELKAKLSSVKVPRQIFVLDDFPRSDAGKVAKNKLRALVS
ncbi:AMP-binding protein (plasmid) [Rhodococcus sp. USK10]|uniref:AMP-binding protein n=1 Tax=Rhodococcus sp. USK10 TaxID=2789739 RepID=UPI001C5F95E5|nr:AMP-binding protein [Rhodococcus sp. USK10]QYB00169.1 AMP-binding protein [Rhodococcus sp. USK10]